MQVRGKYCCARVKQIESIKTKTDVFSFDPEGLGKWDKLSADETNDILWIIDNLYIGNAASASNQDALKDHGITHVINLISHEKSKNIDDYKYLNISLRDTPESDILCWLPSIIDFIDSAEAEDSDSRILFHCK